MFNKEERQFYRLDNILSCKANYMLIYGMRANGKSYAVKERAVIRAYEKGEIFTYLRRWGQDIKQKEVDNYFDDIPVNKITNGEYDGITAYQGSFYFFNNLENGRKDRVPKAIGRYCALNEAERYKSQVFNSKRIIFEEVFTDKIYLGSKERPEPRILMQFISTVARDRDIEVYLIANTVSRVNPYVGEWGLKNVLQQKPGTIDVYHLRGENGVVDIAVENCEVIPSEKNSKFEDIKITLKYRDNKQTRILTGIERVSKPGLRIYSGKEDMPQVLNGLGIAIVTTNEGVMTDREARSRGIGGEVLARVW